MQGHYNSSFMRWKIITALVDRWSRWWAACETFARRQMRCKATPRSCNPWSGPVGDESSSRDCANSVALVLLIELYSSKIVMNMKENANTLLLIIAKTWLLMTPILHELRIKPLLPVTVKTICTCGWYPSEVVNILLSLNASLRLLYYEVASVLLKSFHIQRYYTYEVINALRSHPILSTDKLSNWLIH